MMKFLLLDNYTKQALHVLRVVAGTVGWPTDVFGPGVSLCSFSRYINKVYTSPNPVNRAEYYIAFRKLIQQNHYDAFLCFDDDIVSILSENEKELDSYFYLGAMFPKREAVLISDSKNRMLEFSKKLGVPTPDFYFPENEQELRNIDKKIKFPVVVKGEKGSGSWKVRYASNYEEMISYYRELENLERSYHGKPSVQEYIKGKGHLVHVLCDQGELIRVCDHVKLIEYPPNGGVTAVAQTCYEPSVIEYVKTICKNLHWNGLAKFDFIKEETTGLYKLLEMDPRVSASIIVPQVAGTEMIESFCRMVEGKKVNPDLSFKVGIKYRLILPRECQYLLKNPSHIIPFIKGFFEKDTRSDICLTDIKPTLYNIKGTAYVIKEELMKRGKTAVIASQQLL